MDNIIYIYNQISSDKNRQLAYKVFFESLILELFQCKSQAEFEKMNITNEMANSLLNELDKKFNSYFSVKEMFTIINTKIYYSCGFKDIQTKLINARTSGAFLKKYKQKCIEFNLPQEFLTFKKGPGRPTKKYNVVFWSLFIDFIKVEYQINKNVYNGIKVRNLASLEKELKKHIHATDKYFDIIKTTLNDIEDAYFAELTQLYKEMLSYVNRVFDLHNFLFEDLFKFDFESVGISEDFLKLIFQEFLDMFLEQVVTIFEEGDDYVVQVTKNYNTESFKQPYIFFEDFNQESMDDTMNHYKEVYRKKYQENPDTTKIAGTKSEGIYYFKISKERVLRKIEDDINANFIQVPNHIQFLKDLSTRYIEKPLKLVLEARLEIGEQFNYIFRPILISYFHSKFKDCHLDELESLKSWLILNKWLYNED